MYVYEYIYNTYECICKYIRKLPGTWITKAWSDRKGVRSAGSVSLEYSEKFLKKKFLFPPPLKTPVNHRCYIDTTYSQKTFPFSSPENSKP